MAKKQSPKSKRAAPRQTAKKAAAGKKSAPKKTAKAAARPKTPAKRAAAKAQPMPRPMITAEEKLFLLFKDDYHVRQIFDFLRVETVGELERFSPREIVERLSRPIEESVARIRRKLAEKNRYLSGDEQYLLKAKAAVTG